MEHVNQEEMVLIYYKERQPPEHLAACPECRAGYRRLEDALAAMDEVAAPEPGTDFEARVWRRLEPCLSGRSRAWPRWVAAGAIAAGLMVSAFVAGRWTAGEHSPGESAGAVRQRVLMAALADHLERSEIVLAELANAPAGAGPRPAALDLVEDNRLYRQSAASAGDREIEATLDELERLLLEVAHGPGERSGRARQLLEKIRILGAKARGEESEL